MIPSTREHLREHVRGCPVADIRAAIRAGLPERDEGLVGLIGDWLTSDAPTPGRPSRRVEAGENPIP